MFYHRAQTWWLSDNSWHFRIDIHWLNRQYGTVKKKNLPLTQWSCETVRKRAVSNAMLQMTVQTFSVETNIKLSIFIFDFFFIDISSNSVSITPFFYCSSTGRRLSICRLPHRQGLEETVRSSAFRAPTWPRQTTEGRGGHRQHFGPSRQNPRGISITLPRKMALL